MSAEQWYTNKELFEMINGLTEELRATQVAVKQYNDLRRQLSDHETRLNGVEQRAQGARLFEERLLKWGGWLVGAGGVLLSALLKLWRG